MEESLIRRSSSPFVSELKSRTPSKQHHLDYSLSDPRDKENEVPRIDDTCFSAFSAVVTPRKRAHSPESKSPTYLIDFTQQMLPPSRTEPNLLQHLNRQRSPKRPSLATPKILNLLDFELPPAPTPRSVPTITVRELETLKSQYLSQISSLKATLNGREAEVESLKRAVADAEQRVGDAQQALQEEKTARELAEQERHDWERRGMEVENVLKNVREEVMASEAEKEELLQRVERMQNGDVSVEEQVQTLVTAQIDAKIEAVSRELHAVYKEKHERKVATLKKSYEARNEKRLAEIQTKTPPVETAHIARLESELATSKAQREELEQALERERIEKGDLVAAVDEMLALQANAPGMAAVEDFRKSVSTVRRPSGIAKMRTPGKKMLANIERMGKAAD